MVRKSRNTGALTDSEDYNAFGSVRASSGASSALGYTGEQSDASTGLEYLRARYLDPAVGRFISADTVSPNAPGTQGYNPYAYVANNPMTWTDPSGQAPSEYAIQLTAQVIASQGQLERDIHSICGAIAAVAAGGAMVKQAAVVGGTVSLNGAAAAAGVAFVLCETTAFVAITAPVLVCALTSGCLNGALAEAGVIAAGASDAAAGAIDSSWKSVKRAVTDWPIIGSITAALFLARPVRNYRPDFGSRTGANCTRDASPREIVTRNESGYPYWEVLD